MTKKSDSGDHHHYSDSGLGSSVNSPIEPRSSISARSNAESIATTHSAITKSHSFESSHRSRGRRLSNSAFRHIDQHFLQPVLKDPALKDFHPLIKAIPRQVGDNFISNLRDLEKTLLYQAPRFCLSSKSFQDFWTFSIQCLHTTVQFLNERDQRRPSDRPYTSNYFVDLVEQIRRYAEIMARTREREANGEELDEMDFTPDETIAIEGGLSSSGRPAGLVRKKNGKSISLAPENSRAYETMSSKRPLSDDEFDSEDDDVLRSMARRRKSDKAGDVVHTCQTCSKEFKRPCDLTKHEKTHSRPFKCSDSSCRYYELGWPTEKERDRHVNDKHSANPTLYKCQFQPCSYSSKRESNCKQHMEKAHGWTYVRSKSNGRNKEALNSGVMQSPSSPFSSSVTTPSSSHQPFGTPESMLAASPLVANNTLSPLVPPVFNSFQDIGRRGSDTTAGTTYSIDTSTYSPEEIRSILESVSPSNNLTGNSPFIAGVDLDFAAPTVYQQPTPALSVMDFDFSSADLLSNTTVPEPMNALQPTNLELLTDNYFDEGFGEGHAIQDFQLFDDPVTTSIPQTEPLATNNWFQDLHTGNLGQFDGMSFDHTAAFFPQ